MAVSLREAPLAPPPETAVDGCPESGQNINRHTRRTTVIAVIVALLAALAAGGGVWLAQRDGETPPAATGITTAPTPSAGPTTRRPRR